MYNVITVYCTWRVHCQQKAEEIKHNVFCSSLWYYLYVIIILMSFFLQKVGAFVSFLHFCVQTCTAPLHPYADGILNVSASGGWMMEQEQLNLRKCCTIMAGRMLVRSSGCSMATSAV